MENNVGLLSHVVPFARQHLKTLSQFKNVHVILGNETCDLDSAVSSLVFSLLVHESLKSSESIVIPVFNIPRAQLPIKTEVTYLLTKYGFNLEDFVCRDEIDLRSLQSSGSLKLTLVDHHVLHDSGLEPSLVTVIDHRPPDPATPWSYGSKTYARSNDCSVDVTIDSVGSCCSLIADRILKLAPQLVSPTIATWLLGTILLDTVFLSPLVGKAKPLDVNIVEQLQTLCPQSLDKKKLYKELKQAKKDIALLTSAQLLIKDLKIASGIPIAGLPISVKDFLERDDAHHSIHKFCEELSAEVCVLYGSKKVQGMLTKDIAVFNHNNSELASQVVTALVNCKEPLLSLRPEPHAVQELKLFEQSNIKASRKDVLPIVKNVADSLQR